MAVSYVVRLAHYLHAIYSVALFYYAIDSILCNKATRHIR